MTYSARSSERARTRHVNLFGGWAGTAGLECRSPCFWLYPARNREAALGGILTETYYIETDYTETETSYIETETETETETIETADYIETETETETY